MGGSKMHWRYQNINIPTEVVRTVVAISELGSFSKAGARLGLSQPAISAQMKRLQMLVGGDVFERTGGGLSLTPKGRLVLTQARKLLEANDQILSIGGGDQDFANGSPGSHRHFCRPIFEQLAGHPVYAGFDYLRSLS